MGESEVMEELDITSEWRIWWRGLNTGICPAQKTLKQCVEELAIKHRNATRDPNPGSCFNNSGVVKESPCCERDYDRDGNCDRHPFGIDKHERKDENNV